MQVSEDIFRDVLGPKLGGEFERAVTVFKNYGHHLGLGVSNVLLHAVEQGNVDEVLKVLEKHYDDHLKYQHPDIRGTVRNDLGVNETKAMFTSLYIDVLGFEPQASSKWVVVERLAEHTQRDRAVGKLVATDWPEETPLPKPVVGEPYEFVAQTPLNPEPGREFHTSLVVEVVSVTDSDVSFRTEHASYHIYLTFEKPEGLERQSKDWNGYI
jgi:hypothetical protein